MERVEGIGGFFFRAKDPSNWRVVEANLGVPSMPNNWRTSAGTTVLAPFRRTPRLGDRRFQWMINFRVRDLNKMVAQLRERGIAVELDTAVYPNGRFARLSDRRQPDPTLATRRHGSRLRTARVEHRGARDCGVPEDPRARTTR
jgi:hypothetical protein